MCIYDLPCTTLIANHTGLPFSDWLAVVTPGWNIPLNAVYVSVGFTTLLALVSGFKKRTSVVASIATLRDATDPVQAC